MGAMDKPYVVLVKKVFYLKHGDIKESVSRFGFYTKRGAERFVKRMRFRRDVVTAFIIG